MQKYCEILLKSEIAFLFECILKSNLSKPLLQSSVSHDPSESNMPVCDSKKKPILFIYVIEKPIMTDHYSGTEGRHDPQSSMAPTAC